VTTGGEALYADLGHFGVRPIQIGWFSVVMPGLLLNYFGQGALLLRNPGAADNPFYRLAPEWSLYPLMILATMATVIASQAVISGVFSLTRQAVQLGYAPRMEIVHTSERQIGQIYVPLANWGLMLGTIALVMKFRTASNLAAAYGIAVTTTMIITTLLAFVVARRIWGWKLWAAAGVTAMFLVIDVAFFGANIVKVAQGGWFPLVIAAAVFLIFTSWRRGRSALAARQAEVSLAPQLVIEDVVRRGIPRTPGTAVFLTGQETGTPPALLHNLKHNRVVHDRNLFLTVRNEDVPHIPEGDRLSVEDLGQGFERAIVRYGFMEDPDIPPVLRSIGLAPASTTFFLSRSLVLSRRKGFIPRILDRLFIFMGRNAQVPTQFFRLPPNRVIEIGMQIEI
ncbi:MAG TPA: KUP/HAK/KT family potassium transporter, partial [Thermoanaerobaculia bacterium]|nr:KUP/HAK/KT family potassium transporter [Thermoanaerobaculia bacterium]